MEIESDIDNELLQKLNSLGTRDKEDLLNQFHSIVGTQMSRGCCSFYLEMGNWNLQTALGAYYDVMSSPEKLPLFNVVDESKHHEENSLQPNQSFRKCWRFQNIGNEPWPNNLKLKFVGGTNYSHGECAALPPLEPNDTTDLSIIMIAPSSEGYHQGQWRIITISGTYCGAILNVTVNVDSTNMNSLTKQMSSLGTPTQPMSTPLRAAVNPTPFCSPTGYGIFGGANVPSNGFNGNLPIINEGIHISMDEQQLAERAAQLLYDQSQQQQQQDSMTSSDQFSDHFNS